MRKRVIEKPSGSPNQASVHKPKKKEVDDFKEETPKW
jgi:hypothetical protein